MINRPELAVIDQLYIELGKIPYFCGFPPFPHFLELCLVIFVKYFMLGIFFLQDIAQENCGLKGALVWIAFSKDNGQWVIQNTNWR